MKKRFIASLALLALAFALAASPALAAAPAGTAAPGEAPVSAGTAVSMETAAPAAPVAPAGAFFDWGYLATYSGAIAAVVFIVQFLKLPLDRLGHVPTRAVVYLVSLAILVAARLFTGEPFDAGAIALAALNAVIVAFSAMGLYERALAAPQAGPSARGAADK